MWKTLREIPICSRRGCGRRVARTLAGFLWDYVCGYNGEEGERSDDARRGTSLVTPSAWCEEQAASFPSVETKVIEPEVGRKRDTGVASNAETCTTQTQDFAPTNQ